jgi:hypothetical protein
LIFLSEKLKDLTKGIDGIFIKTFEFIDGKLIIDMELIPSKDYILIKGRNLPAEGIEIIIDNNSIGIESKVEIDQGFKESLS